LAASIILYIGIIYNTAAIWQHNFPVSQATTWSFHMRIRQPLDFGPIIRARRRALGWSQHHLATRAGVGRHWLVELERGKSSAPMDLVMKTLDAIGYVLDVFDDTPARLLASSEAGIRRVNEPSLRREGDRGGQLGEPEAKSPLNAPPPQRFAITGASDTHENSGHPVAITYQIADLEGAGFIANGNQLYDLGYRAVLRRMATHIVVTEAPIFEDLLARRLARAHGLARASRKLLEIAREITQTFLRTTEGDRGIIWPENADARNLVPFRRESLSVRDHVDIPLVELASLAVRFLADGSKPEEAAVLMGRQMGLGRIVPRTRLRLIEAAERAQREPSQL
jgi:transcriptional regulator with XRE-family HTH domain